MLRESEREEAKADDQEKEVDQIAHGFSPPFKYKCEVGTTPFRPSLIPTYDISLRSEFVIFAGSSTSHKIMQTNERYTRRLATLFLGLFLSLLAMVSLHDFSHRADAVQDVVSTEGYTSHVTKTDCSICHFVHTPFLARGAPGAPRPLDPQGCGTATGPSHLRLNHSPEATCRASFALPLPPSITYSALPACMGVLRIAV